MGDSFINGLLGVYCLVQSCRCLGLASLPRVIGISSIGILFKDDMGCSSFWSNKTMYLYLKSLVRVAFTVDFFGLLGSQATTILHFLAPGLG